MKYRPFELLQALPELVGMLTYELILKERDVPWEDAPRIIRWIVMAYGVSVVLRVLFFVEGALPRVMVDTMNAILCCVLIAGGVGAVRGIVAWSVRLHEHICASARLRSLIRRSARG
jgi:hypothetical protein